MLKTFIKFVMIIGLFTGIFVAVEHEAYSFWEEPLVSNGKCVVLVHGLGRSSWSMIKMARVLRRAGYLVWNESYPSKKKPIEELASVIDDGMKFCDAHGISDIHFVTHSLGGILVRYYFRESCPATVKSVVMLGPPNKGSEVTDAFKDWMWYQWFSGKAGQQLGTGPDSIPNTLGPLTVPVGIIAGTATSDPWFSHLFKGENDGKVSVESTQLEGMADFLAMDVGHTFMMNSDTVIEQVLYFLEHNSFKK